MGGKKSWDAFAGDDRSDGAMDSITDGDDIEFPSQTNMIRIGSSATTTGVTQILVPDASYGDRIMITATTALKINVKEPTDVDGDDKVVWHDAITANYITFAAEELIELQRYQYTVSGTTYDVWRTINTTATVGP